MSLREKCAQLIAFDFDFEKPDLERARKLVRAGLGGVCLFYGKRAGIGPVVAELQGLAKEPLLVAADYEHGAGHQVEGATVFPSAMAVGATRSEELAHLKALCTGREALELGVNWVLAPVLDVNSNPLNPIIGTRSFGEDPALVARLARATLRGFRDAGVLSCAKHFPGHGEVAVDSHLSLPRLVSSLDKLRATELVPYRELAHELDAVMTGHLLVPDLDAEPASLSARATRLLREECGFQGLIATDALMMGGLVEHCPDERLAVEKAVLAGADVLLWPRDPLAALDSLVRAVEEGRIAEPRIDESSGRISSVKKKVRRLRAPWVESGEAQRIADAAVTLVRGSGRIPSRIAYVRVDGGARWDPSVIESELAKRATIDPGASTCVVGVFWKQRAFSGKSGLDEELVRRVREALRRYEKTVVVALGSPYVIRHFPEVAEYVATYGEDAASQRAAARALAGEIPFGGSLPVTL